MHLLTNDELRQQRAAIVLHRLDRDYPGHDCTAEDIRAHVAQTHSDEALAAHAHHYRTQKLAGERDYAAQWAKDQTAKKAAAKVTAGHTAKLSHARAKLAEMAEEKETWETRAETLEDQLSALMKRQGR
jgi:hypothetical protein